VALRVHPFACCSRPGCSRLLVTRLQCDFRIVWRIGDFSCNGIVELIVHASAPGRELLDLVYYHECSVKETAEIVGVGEATVKTRVFYARRKLAGLMGAAA
jgi:Sigma-70, region 4